MDLDYNKVDAEVLPESNTRVSAAEYNQLAGSCMEIINASGLTPDAGDNEQLLNALKAIFGPYIVETYSSGTSWYRVWSDGWCEQGGQTSSISTGASLSVQLHKTFSDTDYTLLVTSNSNYYANAQANNTAVKTSSSEILISNGSNISTVFSWEAKGFIAQGN